MLGSSDGTAVGGLDSALIFPVGAEVGFSVVGALDGGSLFNIKQYVRVVHNINQDTHFQQNKPWNI